MSELDRRNYGGTSVPPFLFLRGVMGRLRELLRNSLCLRSPIAAH